MNLIKISYWVGVEPLQEKSTSLTLEEVIPKVLKMYEVLYEIALLKDINLILKMELNEQKAFIQHNINSYWLHNINNKELVLREILIDLHRDLLRSITDKYLKSIIFTLEK